MDPTLDEDHWNLRRPNEILNQVFGLREWHEMRALDNSNYAFYRMLPTSVINTKGSTWPDIDSAVFHARVAVEQHWAMKEKKYENQSS